MNWVDLKRALEESKIRPDCYSLNGGLPNEEYCLSFNANSQLWEVYYSERGDKNSLREFEDEDAACGYFYDWVNNDTTTR